MHYDSETSHMIHLQVKIESLEDDLNGGKTYWYKEEVQRDHSRLEKLKEELENLKR